MRPFMDLQKRDLPTSSIPRAATCQETKSASRSLSSPALGMAPGYLHVDAKRNLLKAGAPN